MANAVELKKVGNYLYVNLRIPNARKDLKVSASVVSGGKRKKYIASSEKPVKEKISPYYPSRKKIDGRIWRTGDNFSLVSEGAEKIIFIVGKRKETLHLADGSVIKDVEHSIDKLKGVFLLFNSNIDKIKYVDDELKRLAKSQKSHPRQLKEISSVDDLFSSVLFAMKTCEPLELMVDAATSDWMSKNISANKKRMGGQAGIMANFLSSIGINAIVYTPLLSKEQCSLFNEDVLLLTDSGLKHPSKAEREDAKKINWVFEYYRGDTLSGIKAKENCRFIASSRPDEFRIGKFDTKAVNKADCVIVSGFQGIKEKYKDGETYKEQFEKAAAILKRIRKMGKPIHIELASTKNAALRKCIIEKIIPPVDSIGMDEMELADTLLEVGGKKSYEKIHEGKITDIFEGLMVLKKAFACGKIQLHGDCYMLAVCKKDYHITAEEIKKSMEFASMAAAAKATGRLNSRSDIWNGLAVEKSSDAAKKKRALEAYLLKKGIRMKNGIANIDGMQVVFVRNRMAQQVEDVVGLGDVISASIFTAENAYRIARLRK